jgi:FlaA1/EpsC-like NDP-sugar epimerase
MANIDIVFHAAAYKHVPMMEQHPWKAVENNIQGTNNLVDIADRFKCERFVFVSTDKAVNPTNIMGASKRVSDIIVQSKNIIENSKTNFITVRFGNVIGSVGSVIPLFKKQIKEGGPVTVTHPDVIRFFMLIPEACQLILQAGAMGKGGEIFVLEMGDPVNIDAMARDLIRFSGFEPDIDIKVEYTGLRPGEKLYEELMIDDENIVPTDHSKIMILNGKKFNMDIINRDIQNLQNIAKNRDKYKIIEQLKKIVPEYQPAWKDTSGAS